jgi:hypothetical protein
LSADLSSQQQDSQIIINFQVWEATKNMQLKLCCGSLKTCVFETDLGLKRGTRKWLSQQAVCPSNTKRVREFKFIH